MKISKSGTQTVRANPPPVLQDDQVLLRILVAQATQRGDTLANLAQALGVSYRRLAQWRRQEANISRAKRSVHERAALYLEVPVILILALAGTVSLADLIWPARESLSARVEVELARMRLDPDLAAFVPSTLANADPAVQLLIAFMYRELNPPPCAPVGRYQWMTALHQTAQGHADGLQALDQLRGELAQDQRLF